MHTEKTKQIYIRSNNDLIYVEMGYPKNLPAPAVVVAHGLRSYYTGFLSMFAKRLRAAGYISVKFHFVGTGYSSGKFEDKSTKNMLQNYRDVIDLLKVMPEVKGIGVVGRSNAGGLAVVSGPDPAIKAYALLAAPAFYSVVFDTIYRPTGKFVGKWFYHKSFKRPHTKGEGRLQGDFFEELRKYDKPVLKNIPKIKPAIYFQSTKDEAVLFSQGHFDYYKKHLGKPNKMVLIKGGNHSYKGHKKFVIEETIKWFKKYLPVKK